MPGRRENAIPHVTARTSDAPVLIWRLPLDTLEALLSRITVPQAMMTDPGPEGDALDRILEAGVSAPDHGRLRPWRFLLVRGEARSRLGALMADAQQTREPAASAEALEKTREAPLRAPLLVVVIASVRPDHPKIPEIEQIASAAAAAQNMLIAAHALGFAGKWSTGAHAYDETVKTGLGLRAHERLLGFLYIGTARGRPQPGSRPALAEIASEWTG